MARSPRPIEAETGTEFRHGKYRVYVGRIRVRANGKKTVALSFDGPPELLKQLTRRRK